MGYRSSIAFQGFPPSFAVLHHLFLFTPPIVTQGMLNYRDCFASITDDRTNMILFIPDGELVIDRETWETAAKFHATAMAQNQAAQKRAAEEDISQTYHPRKMRQWI
jgi:hypothetical protein